jgi:hypothetical protein
MTNAQKTQLIADLIKKLGLNQSDICRKTGMKPHTFGQKMRLRPTYEFKDNEIKTLLATLDGIGCEILALVNKLEQE